MQEAAMDGVLAELLAGNIKPGIYPVMLIASDFSSLLRKEERRERRRSAAANSSAIFVAVGRATKISVPLRPGLLIS